MSLSSAEFGYIVGVLQAKGNFTVHADNSVSVTVTSSPDVVQKLAQYIGTGTIRENNSHLRYFLQRKADVDALLVAVGPYLLGEQAEAAEKVRAHLDTFFETEIDPYSPQRQVRIRRALRATRSYELR
jgi:hypothetical protein